MYNNNNILSFLLPPWAGRYSGSEADSQNELMKLKLENQALIQLLQEYKKKNLLRVHETNSEASSARRDDVIARLHTSHTRIEGRHAKKAKAVHIETLAVPIGWLW